MFLLLSGSPQCYECCRDHRQARLARPPPAQLVHPGHLRHQRGRLVRGPGLALQPAEEPEMIHSTSFDFSLLFIFFLFRHSGSTGSRPLCSRLTQVSTPALSFKNFLHSLTPAFSLRQYSWGSSLCCLCVWLCACVCGRVRACVYLVCSASVCGCEGVSVYAGWDWE